MRITDLYVTGVGAHVPDRVSTPDAVARGYYDAGRAARDGIDAVAVATDLSAPEMAALAGQEAVAMAGGIDAADVRTVFHTYVDYSGARFWDAAPYVALHTVGASARGYDIRQSCNGSLAAIELASHLVPRVGGSVLVTSGERFDTDGVNRWQADPQSVFGDGAGAVVLSGRGGFAKVLSAASAADNRLEGESRGGRFHPNMAAHLDFEALREDYLREQVPLREHWFAMEQVLRGALKEALADADSTIDDIAYLVPINPTYPMLLGMLEHLIPLPEARTTWDIGRITGHVGGADHLIGLHHLVTTGKAGPGDKILFAGGGTGFTGTYVIIEMTGEAPR
ncbi:MAG TPA: ketoacyl-ACP synthase III family protein [Pseudonocardiaceae bacterium]|nr:ketoacyl-ACP synthase III family protein [Pseudonocardiaceae bacterium]